MVTYLALLFASLADPVRFIVCLVIIMLFTHQKGVLISTIIGAVVSFIVMESLLKQTQGLRVFGQGFLWGFPASLIHGFLAYKLIEYFKKRKSLN